MNYFMVARLYDILSVTIRERKTYKMSNKGGGVSWIVIIICLNVFFPLGLYLLVKKLMGDYGHKGNNTKKVVKSSYPLLIAGVVLLIYSMNRLSFDSVTVVIGIGLLLTGLGMRAAGAITRYRERTFKKYRAVIGSRPSVAIAEIASVMAVSLPRATRELQMMIDGDELPVGAYIDMSRNELVIDRSAMIEVESIILTAPEPEQGELDASRREYELRMEDIREIKFTIDNKGVSKQIFRIEELTESIYLAVENTPSKLPQLNRFMNHYLPTTIKLLKSYRHLERQTLGGENVQKSKADIENILAKLVQGFENLLDMLYSTDAVDISAEINVLENLMAADGLTDSPYTLPRIKK